MYGATDAVAILEDLQHQKKQRQLESEDERREVDRGVSAEQVMSEARSASSKVSLAEIGHMSTACMGASEKEVKALAELLESAPPHMKELGYRFRCFLSHRRATGQGIAGRLFEKFRNEYCTFLDSESTFELHNLQMLIEKTNVVIFILTEGIFNKSLFCLLELLTAISSGKEIVLVRDLAFVLPSEPGEIAALCLPVLQGKMQRITACGDYKDEDAAAQHAESAVLWSANPRCCSPPRGGGRALAVAPSTFQERRRGAWLAPGG